MIYFYKKNRIRSGQYSIEDACWENVSNEAKELIRKMLETNPVQRISIIDVTNSNWIRVTEISIILLFHTRFFV